MTAPTDLPANDASSRILCLFDIDGTILASAGVGLAALRRGLLDRFGIVDSLESLDLAGRTDRYIAMEILTGQGIEPTAQAVTHLLDGYLHALGELLPHNGSRLLEGIIDLLEALRAHPWVALALLTGNVAAGAEIKLRHHGAWDYFEFGAFADKHHDRNELGPLALSSARQLLGHEFPPSNIFIIGDTPRDIECGRVIGANTIAVATGRHSLEELAAHSPDHLFADLTDTNAVLLALGLKAPVPA